MINPAPLPSGYYILRDLLDVPAFGFKVRVQQYDDRISIIAEPLMVNNHLIAYDSENGWQETDFSVVDAQAIIDDVLRSLYVVYFEEQSITVEWIMDDPVQLASMPFGEFRGVISQVEGLTENYPVFANPSPIVNGYYVMNSEERLNLDGLCISVEANVASASTVNVRIAKLKKEDRFVVYRQGSFDSVTLDSGEVELFVAESFDNYAQQSLQGTGYTLGTFEVEDIEYFNRLPFAKFFTKLEVD